MEVSPILVPILGLMIPIVAIVAKTMVAPWMELQRRRLDIEAQHTAEKAAQYAAQNERLEARVRVLERIATDRGTTLHEQIEALRDDRLN